MTSNEDKDLELVVELAEGEELSKEALEELSNGKGDDEDE